ncbi:MAG: YifB family Mg chelatase-like AAA ATPase [Alloprevotella sp.]|nr:YifB family Mg chelatase-like AAA ATPase [Alloprevotella sp.]
MLAKVLSAALNGLNALAVTVEVNANLANGGSGMGETVFYMVGLPDNAVRESKQRVQSALANSRFHLPRMNVTANLAPADIRKEGSGFDLPLAIAMLKCADLVKRQDLGGLMFVGELGLDGTVRPVRGALPIAIEARRLGMEALFVPRDNVREAGVVNQLKVYGVETLSQVVDYLNGTLALEPVSINTREDFYRAQAATELDFADVKGQERAKRAFEVAAAGGHNIMLIGSPGCGKSMMAKRFPSILPRLTLAESLETTQIYSIAGKMGKDTSLITQRPFRSPHHTISDVALIGGGVNLQPGEISLAHNGVLFLDEFPEYSRAALETMRQPLEDRQITISRAKYSATLPCSFMLVAAMNPCPCGYYNDPAHECHCTPGQIQRYMGRISGPLLDRIDLQLELTPVPLEELQAAPKGESSAAIRERVIAARAIQTMRFKDSPGVHCNAQMSARQLEQYARLDADGREAMRLAMQRMNLSARAYERILKMARTIADLARHEDITFEDVSEAVGYRNLDRGDWAERGS